MPRKNNVRWHDGSKAWVSAAGEISPKSGRRKPVYFRDIPYGPDGSPNHRKARAAMDAYLAARDARRDEVEDLTLGELAGYHLQWMGHRVRLGKTRPTTLRGHRQALRKFLSARGADGVLMNGRLAGRITATEVGAILDRWAEGHAPNYIGRILASVQAVLNWSVAPLPGRDPERLIPRNPIANLSHEATRAPQSPDRYAEEEEVRAFLEWGYRRAEAYTRSQVSRKTGRPIIKAGPLERRFERLTIDLIRVAYLTGCRPGELRVAEWSDYEARAVYLGDDGQWWGRITLDPGRWKSGGRTGKARQVYLCPEAVGVIESIRALEGRHPRFIWTHKRGPVPRTRQATLARDGEALPSHGVMWSETALPNKVCALRREAIAAGLPLQDGGPNRFVMYRLRHSRAADLLMGGVDGATVAKLLGTSVAMVEGTYGSHSEVFLAASAARGVPGRRGTGSEVHDAAV